MLARPDPESRYRIWRAAAIAATVRQPWVLGALALFVLVGLYSKLVSTAISHLSEIYVSWGAKRTTGAARIRQGVGVCLVVVWVACLVLVFEYHQWWTAFKVFSISTLVFDVFCGLMDWQARRAAHRAEAPEDILLEDIVEWQETDEGAHVMSGTGDDEED